MGVIKAVLGASDVMSEGRKIEVQHLIETTGLSPNQARDLLTKYGSDWERIRLEAEEMRTRAEQ